MKEEATTKNKTKTAQNVRGPSPRASETAAKAHRQRRNQQRQRPNDKDGRATDGSYGVPCVCPQLHRAACACVSGSVCRPHEGSGWYRAHRIGTTDEKVSQRRASACEPTRRLLPHLPIWQRVRSGRRGKKWTKFSGLSWGMGGAAFGAADCWTSVDRVVASVLGPNSEEPLIQIHSVCV